MIRNASKFQNQDFDALKILGDIKYKLKILTFGLGSFSVCNFFDVYSFERFLFL